MIAEKEVAVPPKKIGKRSGSIGKSIGGAFTPKRSSFGSKSKQSPSGPKPKLSPVRRQPTGTAGEGKAKWAPLGRKPKLAPGAGGESAPGLQPGAGQMTVGQRRGCCCGLFMLGPIGLLALVGGLLAGRRRADPTATRQRRCGL